MGSESILGVQGYSAVGSWKHWKMHADDYSTAELAATQAVAVQPTQKSDLGSMDPLAMAAKLQAQDYTLEAADFDIWDQEIVAVEHWSANKSYEDQACQSLGFHIVELRVRYEPE